MASVWITKRKSRATTGGKPRYRVMYRLGGSETMPRYGGSFATKQEALDRKKWIAGELAGMRLPNLDVLKEAPAAVSFATRADKWRSAQDDVTETTRVVHRVALARAMPKLGSIAYDQITVDDVVALVVEM